MIDENTIKETLEEDLRFWMFDTNEETVDEVLEFLKDRNLLNKRGMELYNDFWKRYVRKRYSKTRVE